MGSSSGGGVSYLQFLVGESNHLLKLSLTSAVTIKHSRRMPQDLNDSMRLPSILFACARIVWGFGAAM